jgi:NAD-dependent DNA ligase
MSGYGGLNLQEYIDFLQRYIIVHSYIYYEMDENLISDRDYDAAAKKLVQLKTDYPLLWYNSEYYKQFGDDYNGSTGFTLYHELSDRQKEIIQSIIHNIFRKGD